MRTGHERRTQSRRRAQARTRLDEDELRRAAKIARSMLPRGSDRLRGRDGRLRRMSDHVVVVEALLAVGAAEAALKKTPWNEFTMKALAIVLADITDREAAARAVIVWRKIAALNPRRRTSLGRQIERDLSTKDGSSAP